MLEYGVVTVGVYDQKRVFTFQGAFVCRGHHTQKGVFAAGTVEVVVWL